MKRVLVVEDDPDLADTLAELLARRYTVEVAPDGREAVERLSSNGYDAVVLDLMLPHLSGEGVLEAMKELGLSVPVIIATARDDGGEVMVRGGAADWLRKPFAITDLFKKLERLLAGGPPGGGPEPEPPATPVKDGGEGTQSAPDLARPRRARTNLRRSVPSRAPGPARDERTRRP